MGSEEGGGQLIPILCADGSIELCSLEQLHPSQYYCPDTALWILPSHLFPTVL